MLLRDTRSPRYLPALVLFTIACDDSTQEAPPIDLGPPETVLGVVDGAAAEQFDGIVAVVPGEDSGIVVADRGSGEIRAFSAGGRHLWSTGGQGEGPGEFRRLTRAMATDPPADPHEVVTWDPGLGRLSAFHRTGAFQRTWGLTESDSVAAASPVGVFPDGNLLVAGADPGDIAERPPEGRVRFATTYAEYDAEGTFLRTLLRDVPGTERLRGVMNGRQLALPAPFPRRTLAHASADFLVVGANEGPWLDLVDRGTLEVRRIEWEQAPAPVTAEHMEAFIEDLAGGAPSGGDMIRQVVEVTDPPSHMPWYDQLVVSPSAEIWVREYPPPGTTDALWRVFTPQGELVHRVALPSTCRLHNVTADRLAAVCRDDLDVETVQLFQRADWHTQPDGDTRRSARP